MKIHHAHLTARNTEAAQSRSVARLDSAGKAGQAPSASSQAEDRIEISPQARAVAAERALQEQELSVAREALHEQPPLHETRLQQLRLRIEEGYYGQPDVLRSIADRLIETAKKGQ